MSTYHDRKAQQLLRNPQTREALEKLLGGKIAPRQPEGTPKDKPIVAALVPCYHHPQPRMQQAFIEMQRASQDTCLFYPGPPVSSSVIHWSRNWLIAGLIKTQKPWTHVLFIDDDIVPPPDALNKLLSHKVDIIAALCTRRMDPPIPNIRKFNPATQMYEEMWQWVPGLQEVGAAGTGMMLISREALVKVQEAYCSCMYEQEMYGLTGERLREIQEARTKQFDIDANGFWFRFLPCLNGGKMEMGEDVGFCFIASRYCGLKIYCDTTVQPGHVGEYVYSIPDYLPHQRLAILRSKAESQWQKPSDNKAIISVLLPTRDRADAVRDSAASLIANASCPENVEILVRIDDDDTAKYELPQQCRVLTGERHGYRNLHRYFNEMAAQAQGEWLMLWNDDAMMETPGWDDKIRNAGSGLQVLNPSGEMNVFPITHRSVYELLGHLSLQAHTDTWLQEVSRATQIERYLPLQIAHEPTPSNYTETRPEFFSETMTRLRQADAERIVHALEAVPVG